MRAGAPGRGCRVDGLPLPARQDIHVWPLRLDVIRAPIGLLSEDECARARRYRCRQARHCFMQTRAVLRLLLGRYLGLPPQDIRLETGPWGKPALNAALPCLAFNVSHSGQLALIALGRTPLGVDIEDTERSLDWRGLVPACCHPDELGALTGLPEREGRLRFLRLWTLKEAYVKGTGRGLGQSPDQLRLVHRGPVWHVAGDAGWRLQALSLPDGYLGSIATTLEHPFVRLMGPGTGMADAA